MKIVFIILFFIMLFALVLGIIIPIYKNHKKISNGIINYDSTMRRFVYKVNLSRQEVIKLLKTKNEVDELICSFNDDETIITIAEYSSNRKYYFEVREYKEYSILRLEQIALIGTQSWVSYKLNPFISSKLQAEIIPFSQYGY